MGQLKYCYYYTTAEISKKIVNHKKIISKSTLNREKGSAERLSIYAEDPHKNQKHLATLSLK